MSKPTLLNRHGNPPSCLRTNDQVPLPETVGGAPPGIPTVHSAASMNVIPMGFAHQQCLRTPLFGDRTKEVI